MCKLRFWLLCLVMIIGSLSCSSEKSKTGPVKISGIYPHLAMFNSQNECGIGAVVPWAGRLWAVTYSPHRPEGSDDRLYEIDPQLNLTIRSESVGGPPANRLIHRESKQLIIGPYFIDKNGGIRVISPETMMGRLSATARHLENPTERVYFFTMEEGLYEVDVNTLAVNTIYPDTQIEGTPSLIPGYHGKGAYSGQDRLVVSNNGTSGWRDPDIRTSGSLAEWDEQTWKIIAEQQYTEVTGPGGIEGNSDIQDPIWATGWDERSIILKLLDNGKWFTFRLPKASFTYDGRHGWHTEWPRIREIDNGRLLMTMHGTFFEFPKSFSHQNTAGILPLSTYLKMIVDYCLWEGQLVFACNDASKFDNAFVGQAQSNLWFLQPQDLRDQGPVLGFGGVWLDDEVKKENPSAPFLINGYSRSVIHLAHKNSQSVTFALEIDELGQGQWNHYNEIEVPPNGYTYHILSSDNPGQWLRIKTDQTVKGATAFLHLNKPESLPSPASLSFSSLPAAGADPRASFGLIRPRGDGQGTLEFAAQAVGSDGHVEDVGFYVVDKDLNIKPIDDPAAWQELQEQIQIKTPDFEIDESSVILIDQEGRRFRLPKGTSVFDNPTTMGWPRGQREVVTERALINSHGTFYELPRDISGGIAGIKPVCTHNRMIHDYCSWRGLLVLSGNTVGAEKDGHFVPSTDGRAGLWFGTVDDLWHLGKPQGEGGPWKQTEVKANEPSDPYLMTGYDQKSLKLSHNAPTTVTFQIEVDITAQGDWFIYKKIQVKPGETGKHEFPAGYSAHWVRIRASDACAATALFTYK